MNDREDTAPLPANNRLALRQVARAQPKAALATSLDGRPYASLTTLAFDHDLSPILLLSGLADHTRNLRADPRAALLLDGTDGCANPQTGPRVTLVGTAREDAAPRLRARFLARHPAAALYAGFADFAVWRIELERAHFVGGFGRAVWFDAPLVAEAPARAMAEAEPDLLARLNRHHAENLNSVAAALDPPGGQPWVATGLDLDGCDLMSGERRLRLGFPQAADTPEAAIRAVLTQAGSSS